jgi:hypothetical protein
MRLKLTATTPFLCESKGDSPQQTPCSPDDDAATCPCCKHCFPKSDPLWSVHPDDVRKGYKAAKPVALEGPSGALKPAGASISMKILYGSRVSRPDLLRATCSLATCITRWGPEHDRRLERLVSYVSSTKHWRNIGVIGDSPADLSLHVYADDDLAGCTESQRSTSGMISTV